MKNRQDELLMANRFHDATNDSSWYLHRDIIPGGWAVDYGFCLTLFRVLNIMRPQQILECGLGQSSKLIHQYANAHHAKALTVEHDREWIDLMEKEINGKYPVSILQLDTETINYNGEKTLVYKDFEKHLASNHYDLLVIDGPYGSPHFSRIQSVEVIKGHLADHFCIILDDTERLGEQETVSEIKHILDEKKIPYITADYSSSKRHTLICSADLKFLTTLC